MPALASPEAASPNDAMSLDFSFPDDVAFLSPLPAARASDLPAFDPADISFDLDLPETLPPGAPGRGSALDAAPMSGFGDVDLPPLDGDEDPLSRKLALAEEFRQIGDTDGARDLLQEVVSKASGAIKTRAEGMLAALG